MQLHHDRGRTDDELDRFARSCESAPVAVSIARECQVVQPGHPAGR